MSEDLFPMSIEVRDAATNTDQRDCGGSVTLPGERRTIEEARQLIATSLSSLGPMASRFCCVLPDSELEFDGLGELGFAAVGAAQRFVGPESGRPDVDAFLIVSFGTDAAAAKGAVEELMQNDQMPPVTVIVIVPFLGCRTVADFLVGQGLETEAVEAASSWGPSDPRTWLALEEEGLFDPRAVLLEAGADDVLCLFAAEPLRPWRLMEGVSKAAILGMKASSMVEREVSAAREHYARKLQEPLRQLLGALPGRVLDSLPREDGRLGEEQAENDDGVKRIGDYALGAELGTGTLGRIFAAKHPVHGSCAVKVSPKAVKSAGELIRLDREICLLLHIPPHPNIVRAHAALHSPRNFYTILEYAGSLHLHKFAKAMMERTGSRALPWETVSSFCGQQALAVQHLHGSMVCHRDLKPDNWLVSDSGEVVRLADFGLARHVVGAGQRLKDSCGSLPFCAPEVVRVKSQGPAGPGYDGFAADIWSLAVNYMELLRGPYSIEELLGWVPRHPQEQEEVVYGLDSLVRLWREVAHEEGDASDLAGAIVNMLLREPTQRWGIEQVVGAEGLALPPQAPAPTPACRGRRSPSVASAASEASCQGAEESHAGTPPCRQLQEKLVVSAALDQMVDRFLSTPGFRLAFSSVPQRLPALRAFFAQEAPKLFDGAASSDEEEAIRAKAKEVHAGIVILDVHVGLLCDYFRTALRCHGFSEARAAEAGERLSRLGAAITGDCAVRLADARTRNTAIWRCGVLAGLRQPRVASFAGLLMERVARSEQLQQTLLRLWTAHGIEAAVLRYLADGCAAGGAGLLPLAPGEGPEGGPAHLELVGAVREALGGAGWPPEAVETLHLSMLQEWKCAHQNTQEA